MMTDCRSAFLVLLTGVFLASPSLAQDAADLIRPFQDEFISIRATFENLNKLGFETEDRSFGKHHAFSGYGVQVPGGHRTVRFTIFPNQRYRRRSHSGDIDFPANQWLAQRQFESVSLNSGVISSRDRVPLFGTLYRVASISIPDGATQGATIKLVKVPKEDWPEGVRFDPYGYAIPNGGSLSFGRFSHGFNVSAKYLKADANFKVTLTVQGRDAHSALKDVQKLHFDAKEGAIIRSEYAPRCGFRITRIVKPAPRHPDPNQRVAGWVEVRHVWPKLVPYGFDHTLKLKR